MNPAESTDAWDKDAVVIWHKLALALAQGIANDLNRTADYKRETRETGFQEAAESWTRALWRWVIDQTADDLRP